jgi:hypothetical protein
MQTDTEQPVLPTEIQRRLRELHDYYVFQVNVAVEEGREHEIDGLVARYPEEAAQLIEEVEAGVS